jgi:hypothetical protein
MIRERWAAATKESTENSTENSTADNQSVLVRKRPVEYKMEVNSIGVTMRTSTKIRPCTARYREMDGRLGDEM